MKSVLKKLFVAFGIAAAAVPMLNGYEVLRPQVTEEFACELLIDLVRSLLSCKRQRRIKGAPLTQNEMRNVRHAITRAFNILGPFGRFEVTEQQMEDAGLHHLLGGPDGQRCKKTIRAYWGDVLFYEPILLVLNHAPVELIDCVLDDLRQMPSGVVPMDGWSMANEDLKTLKDQFGNSLLHYAATQGRSEVISLLLRRGFDPNVTNENEEMPLDCACIEHNYDAIRMLLATNQLPLGPTLCRVVERGDRQMIRALLDHNRARKIALPVAITRAPISEPSNLMAMRSLARFFWNYRRAVRSSVAGDYDTVANLIGPRLYGMYACEYCWPDIARVWFGNNNNIIPEPPFGPVAWAPCPLCSQGSDANVLASLTTVLHHEGVNPNGRDTQGRTPLHAAVARDSMQAIELLLDDPRVDQFIADNAGETPRDLAVRLGHRSDLVQLLDSRARWQRWEPVRERLVENYGDAARSLVNRLHAGMRYLGFNPDALRCMHE